MYIQADWSHRGQRNTGRPGVPGARGEPHSQQRPSYDVHHRPQPTNPADRRVADHVYPRADHDASRLFSIAGWQTAQQWYEPSRTRHASYRRPPGYPHSTRWMPPYQGRYALHLVYYFRAAYGLNGSTRARVSAGSLSKNFAQRVSVYRKGGLWLFFISAFAAGLNATVTRVYPSSWFSPK